MLETDLILYLITGTSFILALLKAIQRIRFNLKEIVKIAREKTKEFLVLMEKSGLYSKRDAKKWASKMRTVLINWIEGFDIKIKADQKKIKYSLTNKFFSLLNDPDAMKVCSMFLCRVDEAHNDFKVSVNKIINLTKILDEE